MKHIAPIILQAIVVASSLSPAVACDCVDPDFAEAWSKAHLVFRAEVTSVVEASTEPSVTQVAVKQVWKGSMPKTLTVNGCGVCDYSFEKGASYLIFAARSEGKIYVYSCSRTGKWAERKEDLPALDAKAAAK